MAATKTTGVVMQYSAAGKTFSKTLNGFDATAISDSDDAATFAKGYARIVDGELKSATFVETTPVTLDA